MSDLTPAEVEHLLAWTKEARPCRFESVIREADGAYTAACQCGWFATGPNEALQPRLDTRKDAAWNALVVHFKPLIDEIRAMNP